MYLEHISIRNFRKFEYLDLTLNPGLNVLVGENDSGKTTLIDAIRYVLGTNSSERAFLDESDFHDDATELSIQLKFVDVERHAHVFVEHLTYEKDPTWEEVVMNFKGDLNPYRPNSDRMQRFREIYGKLNK